MLGLLRGYGIWAILCGWTTRCYYKLLSGAGAVTGYFELLGVNVWVSGSYLVGLRILRVAMD
jgi:hypothetical protein